MRALSPRLKLILFVFAALALIAGALLFVGATRTEDYFSWTIEPPLTAATLGAFYVLVPPLLARDDDPLRFRGRPPPRWNRVLGERVDRALHVASVEPLVRGDDELAWIGDGHRREP